MSTLICRQYLKKNYLTLQFCVQHLQNYNTNYLNASKTKFQSNCTQFHFVATNKPPYSAEHQ